MLTDRHHGPELPPVVLARTTDLRGARHRDAPAVGHQPDARDASATTTPSRASSGSVDEKGLLERVFRDPTTVGRTVGELMERPLPTIDIAASLDEAFDALSSGADALVAVHDGRPAGVVTKLDLLEHLAHVEFAPEADPGAHVWTRRWVARPCRRPVTLSPQSASDLVIGPRRLASA